MEKKITIELSDELSPAAIEKPRIRPQQRKTVGLKLAFPRTKEVSNPITKLIPTIPSFRWLEEVEAMTTVNTSETKIRMRFFTIEDLFVKLHRLCPSCRYYGLVATP